ncbi:uncharacterized protein wu:fj16a03 isoform X1 [Osmerus eperlanus]|uniref:uncharacterized protein wu:fj16a03 isoform X1 n=1 Tax=Osmerus eperlanus TaxID=29151 RepID=UPI002E0E4A44
MKACLVLVLLLPLLCTAGRSMTPEICSPSCAAAQQFTIECYGEDFLMVRNQVLQCSSKVVQACYTRETGEKGCARLEFCDRPGWSCCFKNRCNA